MCINILLQFSFFCKLFRQIEFGEKQMSPQPCERPLLQQMLLMYNSYQP